MPWTTLVLITVLFSVICGNRLIDNRLLRYSSAGGAFKPSNENNKEIRETLSKFKNDLKAEADAKFLESLSPATDVDTNYQLELRNHNCHSNDQFENFLKNERFSENYPGEEELTADVGSLPSYNELNIYENFKPMYDGDMSSFMGGGIDDKHVMDNMLASLPIANYKDFYADLVLDSYEGNKNMGIKRNGNSIGSTTARGCDCKVKNDLVDLGQQHFPRYLLNAVCHTQHDSRNGDIAPKCWSGSMCRPLEYKVKVLTFRTVTDNMQKDPTLAWLPDDLRPVWKFKTVTVTAGCFCS